MDGSFAKELYSESLELSTPRLSHPTDDLQDGDDGSLWGGSDDGLDKPSELDREWKKRRDEFYAVGYRDGLIAGKEAIAQEGFNVGFKQSVIPGYNWGIVRGVSCALSSLPESLKEKLVQTEGKRKEFQNLHESTSSISTKDALKLFHEDVLAAEEAARNGGEAEQQQQGRTSSRNLGRYAEELNSLLLDSPAIESHLMAK
ncbi:hypothetical protein LINGRAHAP2_LOCUS8715 [Linum grandiflorum]